MSTSVGLGCPATLPEIMQEQRLTSEQNNTPRANTIVNSAILTTEQKVNESASIDGTNASNANNGFGRQVNAVEATQPITSSTIEATLENVKKQTSGYQQLTGIATNGLGQLIDIKV